jgi:hypothetical protein
MGKRSFWIWPLSICLGCTNISSTPVAETPSTGEGVILVHYDEEPAKPPEKPPVADSLQRAAACLERGDDAAAVSHLARYVETHPEHVTIRAHYAELLLRQERRAEARRQFERYVRDAQQQGEPACKHLVHVETRLVEIAQAENDSFAEHLHRGIGLLLLARQVSARPEIDGPDPEKMLFKAAAELKEASKERPDEARPHWYAFEVWSQLGQQLPAQKSLRRAHDAAPASDLTPLERQELAMAWNDGKVRR